MAGFGMPSAIVRDWWDSWDYPPCIMEQCFANSVRDKDLIDPSVYKNTAIKPRTRANIGASGKSEVIIDDKGFKIALDVSQFKPEELEVKVVNNYVVVHGKHDERSDEHGLVTREFSRRYMLPSACEMDTVSSLLSLDGILTINARNKAVEAVPKQERQIPISAEKAD